MVSAGAAGEMLLMAHDRLRGDEVPLTHEFLSLMLGVRGAGVTVALHYLKDRGLIELAHGQIVMTDRAGLRAAANGTERRFSNVSWTFCIVAHWFAL